MVDFSFPGGGGGGVPGAVVVNRLASATPGGAHTNGAWRTRAIDELDRNVIGASVGSNRLTLQAGSYWIDAAAACYRITTAQARIYDITGSAELLTGPSMVAGNSQSTGLFVPVFGLITISVASAIELQTRGYDTKTVDGMGTNPGFGSDWIAAVVRVYKI